MKNPFVDNKLDHEKYPVLWFSPRSRKTSERGKATFVNGTRGSGKTAILRSLSTRYIYEIPSLKEQILSKKRLGWFGTYVRLQDSYADFLVSTNLSEAKPASPEETKREFLLFCQYTELMIVAQLLQDLIVLRRQNAIKISYEQELESVTQYIEDSSSLKRYCQLFSDDKIASFSALNKTIKNILTWLFNLGIGEQWALSIDFIATTPGSLINFAAETFLKTIRCDHLKQGNKLVLKILIDDCEVLPAQAQKYLNTLVRSKDNKVSWVISFVSHLYDTRSTIRENQMLSEADRHMDYLDKMPKKDFEELCSNISSLRIYQHLPPELRIQLRTNSPLTCFDLTARLGNIELDDLIAFKKKNALSSVWDPITETAVLWQDFLSHYESGTGNQKTHKGELPYTLSHAATMLNITMKQIEFDLAERHGLKKFKRRMARKQRASYLDILDQANVEPVYAGKRIILALSDSCIRDFLDIMREIFDRSISTATATTTATAKSLLQFADSQRHINLNIQNISVHEASKQKFENINIVSDPYGFEVSRLIQALGMLTKKIQVNGEKGLRTPEINVFAVDWSSLDIVLKKLGFSLPEIDNIIKASGVDGFVRELDDNLEILAGQTSTASTERFFRLHARYAPRFGFSFRGGYSYMRIHSQLFAELLLSSENFDINHWVERVVLQANQKNSDPNQRTLPGFIDGQYK